MFKYFAAVALLILAGCDGPSAGGRQVATACNTGITSVARTVGPCYDGTDRTDRTNRDDRLDRTDRTLRQDLVDRTDRRNRDDLTDRTVWCDQVAAVIQSPSFIVFFDFDKIDLSPVSQDTIRRAAAAYKSKGGAQVNTSGHTDTVGTGPYNMALSQRRVDQVKAALIQEGVKESDISVVALGKTQPMVPTGDGVRERQNRRVEIVIR